MDMLLNAFPLPTTNLTTLFIHPNSALYTSLQAFIAPCTVAEQSSLSWIMSPSPAFSFDSFLDTRPPPLDVPTSPPLPSPTASPPATYAHPLAEAIAHFQALDRLADDLSLVIASLLTGLVRNAQKRVETVYTLQQLRLERDTVLQLEFAAQQRSRELLITARREMALQESWTAEIREVFQRAEREGLDVSGNPRGWSQEGQTAEVAEQKEQEWQEEMAGWSTEAKLQEERRELFRRQLAYLTHSLSTSEHRTTALLNRLSTSSTSQSTRAELARLHVASTSASTLLGTLSTVREATGQELKGASGQRDKTEERKEEAILDWVLGWDLRRRDRRRRSREREMPRLVVVK